MIFLKNWGSLVIITIFCFGSKSYAGIKVALDEKASIQFPSAPDIMDTLGQLSYSITDAIGYYSCIVIKNLVKDPSSFDLQKFYKQMYERMQDPSHGCQLIKESGINHTDIIGVEYYTTCQEMPDFPEIRFKRFFVFKNDFYVIDFWTNKSQIANAASFKSSFFNSLVFIKNENAVIPSAFETSNTKAESRNTPNTLLYIFIPVLILSALYFFQKRPPKK